MLQWIGVGVTLLGFVYNTFGFIQQNGVLTNSQQPLQYVQQPVIQQVRPMSYYAYDPNTNKWYIYSNGQWYEQAQTYQTQYQAPMGIVPGSQSASFGQRDARFSPQASTNPWVR